MGLRDRMAEQLRSFNVNFLVLTLLQLGETRLLGEMGLKVQGPSCANSVSF